MLKKQPMRLRSVAYTHPAENVNFFFFSTQVHSPPEPHPRVAILCFRECSRPQLCSVLQHWLGLTAIRIRSDSVSCLCSPVRRQNPYSEQRWPSTFSFIGSKMKESLLCVFCASGSHLWLCARIPEGRLKIQPHGPSHANLYQTLQRSLKILGCRQVWEWLVCIHVLVNQFWVRAAS